MHPIHLDCKVTLVVASCEDCLVGFMKQKGDNFGQPDPLQKNFEHFCTNCGKTEMLDDEYPYYLVQGVAKDELSARLIEGMKPKKIYVGY